MQIEGMEIYKIGNSKSPKIRVKGVQTGNPFKVVVVDSYPTERASAVETSLHNILASYKVTDDDVQLQGEWFKLDLATRQNFKVMCERIDNNFKIIEEMSTLNKKSY